MSGKQMRKVMKELDSVIDSQVSDLVKSMRAKLIVDGEVVDEVSLPGGGAPQFKGYKVETPGDGVTPNAIVEVVVKDGQKQSYPVVATSV